MKNSELRKVIARYGELVRIHKKIPSDMLAGRIAKIKHRYFYETERVLKSDLGVSG